MMLVGSIANYILSSCAGPDASEIKHLAILTTGPFQRPGKMIEPLGSRGPPRPPPFNFDSAIDLIPIVSYDTMLVWVLRLNGHRGGTASGAPLKEAEPHMEVRNSGKAFVSSSLGVYTLDTKSNHHHSQRFVSEHVSGRSMLR